ncbi:MAG: NADH-quinone oxidoreductase subunit NuoE [bacterium]
MNNRIYQILNQYKPDRASLIPILQAVQKEFDYLPEEAISDISEYLKISESEVFGVASFYSQFRFNRPGKHQVRVCLGTACHVRGGENILSRVEDELHIKPGQTTEDFQFSLDRVACFGCCALAPVVVVDDDVFANLALSKVKKLLGRYKGSHNSRDLPENLLLCSVGRPRPT